MTSQHDIQTEWESAPSAGKRVRRPIDARDDPEAPQFDAGPLVAALHLDAKPVSSDVARKVEATYAIPYDSLMARRRRAISAK